MRYFGYYLKTSKFIFSNLITLLFSLLICLLLSNNIQSNYSFYKSFTHFDCLHLTYDNWAENNDSYSYYANESYVTLDQEGKNALSIDIYQYLDNTTYGNKSVPNPNMIVSGTYKVLEAQEIGICTATAKRYNLKVGSTIYVQNKQSTVKYIFEDVSTIKNIDFKSLKKTIFVGKGTITDVPQLYANFSPDLEATGHLSQYTFDISDIRKDIRGKFFNSTIEITALIGAFNLLIGLIFAIPLWFYSSNEQKRTGYKSTRSLIVFSLLDSLASIIFISVPALFFKPFIIFLICLFIGVVLAILKNAIQIIVLERSVVHGK